MKKFFTVIIACMLMLPIYAEYSTLDEPVSVINSEEEVYQENAVQQTEIPPPQIDIQENIEPSATTFKQPISKKKIAKKFIIAMLCVVGCSIFLFITLTVYNKFRESFIASANIKANEEDLLSTPTELIGAVSRFIEKTKW